MTDSIQKTCS